MFTFHDKSPNNKQMEDFCIKITDSSIIPDDTIILVSTNTSRFGGAYRFVQVQYPQQSNPLSFVISFDDNFGQGNDLSDEQRCANRWSVCTDYKIYHSVIPLGLNRFSQDLKDLINLNTDIISDQYWDQWVHTVYQSDVVREIEKIINDVIPFEESVSIIELSYMITVDYHEQQIELHKHQAQMICDNIHRYKDMNELN